MDLACPIHKIIDNSSSADSRDAVTKFTDEQYTTSNQSTAGHFDLIDLVVYCSSVNFVTIIINANMSSTVSAEMQLNPVIISNGKLQT